MKRLVGTIWADVTQSGVFHELFNNETISVDTSNRVIFFRNNRAPLKYAAVRNLLIKIGFMSRDFGMQNVFVLLDEHYDWFLAGLIEWTSDSQIARGRSIADLKKRLERQAQAGLIGEEYVLGYEKSRLAKHRSVDSVSMISDKNVGAGYDILSFADEASVIFDRFIEVKSYIGEPSFFWSANEIRIAKEKGNLYFLCLVNLNEINLPEYQPIFIQNPAKSIFNDENWVHHCENTHFFRK